MTTLIKSSIFPGLYTTIGCGLGIPSLSSLNWSENIKMNLSEMTNYASSKLQDMLQHGFFFEGLSTNNISRIFTQHTYEIQTAFAWGLSATALNLFLKKNPYIKDHTKTRVFLAAGGAAVVLAATQYVMTSETNPQLFLDVAAKTILIGAGAKCANQIAKATIEGIKQPPKNFVTFVHKVCDASLKVLSIFDWPQFSEEKSQKKNPPLIISESPVNNNLTQKLEEIQNSFLVDDPDKIENLGSDEENVEPLDSETEDLNIKKEESDTEPGSTNTQPENNIINYESE